VLIDEDVDGVMLVETDGSNEAVPVLLTDDVGGGALSDADWSSDIECDVLTVNDGLAEALLDSHEAVVSPVPETDTLGVPSDSVNDVWRDAVSRTLTV
jgi:hypothetical protein